MCSRGKRDNFEMSARKKIKRKQDLSGSWADGPDRLPSFPSAAKAASPSGLSTESWGSRPPGAGGAGPAGPRPRTEVPWNKAGPRGICTKTPREGGAAGEGLPPSSFRRRTPTRLPCLLRFQLLFPEASRVPHGSCGATAGRVGDPQRLTRDTVQTEVREGASPGRLLEVEGNSGSGSLLPSTGAPLCTQTCAPTPQKASPA